MNDEVLSKLAVLKDLYEKGTITEEQFRNLPFVKMPKDTDGKDFLFECLSNTL